MLATINMQCIYLSELGFLFSDKCIEVELLDLLGFLGNLQTVLHVAALTYIPIDSVKAPVFYILADSHSDECEGYTVWFCVSLTISDIEHLSRAC